MLNVLDVLLLIGLMAILGGAFFNGVSRTVASVVAVYLAVICAGAFYVGVTDVVRRFAGIGETAGQLSFFVVILLTFSVAFTLLIARWIEGVRMPRWFSYFDRIGGAVIGLLVAGSAVTVAAMLLSVLVHALQQVALYGEGPLVDIVDSQMDGSSLVPFFLRLSPYFIRLVKPWFPGDLPQLLDVVA